jgi:hypothetical protein
MLCCCSQLRMRLLLNTFSDALAAHEDGNIAAQLLSWETPVQYFLSGNCQMQA